MFLDDDEYIIIMDMNRRHKEDDVSLTTNEMARLKEAGIRTVYLQGLIRWDQMQPEEDRPIDWTLQDGFVERARAAGLKMLIPCLFSMPAWLPDDHFYSRKTNGQIYDVPACDNPEAAEVLDDFIMTVIERYGGDDAQVIYSIPGNGEFALNGHGRMDYPMDVFTSWVVERQRILVAQHNEVWTAYHPIFNPGYWRPVYGALYSEYPYARHYGIIFTYVQHELPCVRELISFNQDAGMIYYAGSEYVQGLRENMKKLLGGRMRALTAPKHPYQRHQEIKEWMLNDIGWAIGQYREAIRYEV